MTDDYADRCQELAATFYRHAQAAIKEGNVEGAVYMSRKALALHLESDAAADADEWEVAPDDPTR